MEDSGSAAHLGLLYGLGALSDFWKAGAVAEQGGQVVGLRSRCIHICQHVLCLIGHLQSDRLSKAADGQ